MTVTTITWRPVARLAKWGCHHPETSHDNTPPGPQAAACHQACRTQGAAGSRRGASGRQSGDRTSPDGWPPLRPADPHRRPAALSHRAYAGRGGVQDPRRPGRAGELGPLPFPAARGGVEPRLSLAELYGPHGTELVDKAQRAGQIVFHAVGDTGNTRSTEPQNMVADKLATDFQGELDAAALPLFFLHLGDVIYSFGEAKYYYDQFYEPYREYPGPIIALAGNHDGIVAPNTDTPSLDAFRRNFCAEGFIITPEAGGLDRTAQIQPGVYFTFEAPFLRVLCLYSNALEDPGVISTQGGKFPDLSDVQLDFLRAALTRVKDENYAGALVIAHHHPIYTAGGKHGWSPDVRDEIDAICKETGIWPHAVLSAHAHNYQRFTRSVGERQIPYLVAGGGGHGVSKLVRGRNASTLRTPAVIDQDGGGQVVLENYDDQDYGYLRIVVTPQTLRIEYHPATDGGAAKTPDDFVNVDLASRRLVHFNQ